MIKIDNSDKEGKLIMKYYMSIPSVVVEKPTININGDSAILIVALVIIFLVRSMRSTK